jgi:hypothetical protein
LAAALAVCEAWQSGYVASLLNRGADLVSYDAVNYAGINDNGSSGAGSSNRERAAHAIERAIEWANPRHQAAGLDDPPSAEAVQALYALLTAQVRFHEAAIDIERRQWHRLSANA